MESIVFVGIDVHTTNFTFCCCERDEKGGSNVFGRNQVQDADYKTVLKYLKNIQDGRPKDELHFVCGYEAGCLGYSLYWQLTKANSDVSLECRIVAPSTLLVQAKRIKTDRRDAENIARNMANATCKYVNVPTEMDNAVKEYIRMRDDEKSRLKAIKQQIIALCTRNGKQFSGSKSYWTIAHRDWLKNLQFDNVLLKETLDEYLLSLQQSEEKIKRYDQRINELASQAEYKEKVDRLCCLKGISTHTALAVVAEISDFSRFRSANLFAAYLGLVPGEHSSGNHIVRTPITKAGNSHLRRLLVEACQGYSRGSAAVKSAALKQRQEGMSPQVVNYADRARIRMTKKFRRIEERSGYNVAKTAAAREMACFIWGLMTDNIA